MAKIFGQLEKAQLENVAASASGTITGQITFNTASGKVEVSDGALTRALLRNDGKAVMGNSATASDNVRLHRGGVSILQFVLGNDTTAEGTLSSSIAQIGMRTTNFLFAGLPAPGNAGRLAWVTDKSSLQIDNGTAWQQVGSGGGGGSLQWVEDDNSPISLVEYNSRVYSFQSGLSQFLYALVKVPSSYVSGSPIKMRIPFYSADAAGTAQISSVATLIRMGVDPMNTVAFARPSTNAAVALTAGTVNTPQSVVLDLTDATGNITATPVSPGDLIRIRLTRGVDTGTSDLKVPVYGAEVTFQ